MLGSCCDLFYDLGRLISRGRRAIPAGRGPRPATSRYTFVIERPAGLPPTRISGARAIDDEAAVRLAAEEARVEHARSTLAPDARVEVRREDGSTVAEFSFGEVVRGAVPA